MARLPYLDKSDLLPEHQDLLARNLNLYRVLAHSPRAARSLNTWRASSATAAASTRDYASWRSSRSAI